MHLRLLCGIGIFFTLICSCYGFRIGAFNVQVFGVSKSSKPDVLNVIAKIVLRYDIILIQEIRDASETTQQTLLDEVNRISTVGDYKMNVSVRLGRTSSKEQYAFYYRNNGDITIIEPAPAIYNDTGDVFEREPFFVKFKVTNLELQEFVLGGIHVKPSDAVAEINALTSVFAEAIDIYGTENVIIMGDLNADCSYVSNSDWLSMPIKSDSTINWMIGDNIDTTVSATDCAYDRILLKGQNLNDSVVTGSAKVFLYDQEHSLNSTMALDVSDHYPVEFSLKTVTVDDNSENNSNRISDLSILVLIPLFTSRMYYY